MGEQEENHLLCHCIRWLIPHCILLRVLTCGRKLLGLWPATQENPSARWSAPNFHQPDSVILQVRLQPRGPPSYPLLRTAQESAPYFLPSGLGSNGKRKSWAIGHRMAMRSKQLGECGWTGSLGVGEFCGICVPSPGGQLGLQGA